MARMRRISLAQARAAKKSAARRFENLSFVTGVGITRVDGHYAVKLNLCEPVKPGSCGRPGDGTVIEVMDEELRPVPDGQEGVLCVRRDSHPGMMKEYWRKPERTDEVFRGEWYWSGDVVVRDADGQFWFKGRADDVIKASGYRISPFEVESCLVCHPAVLEAAAVESPDPVRGQVLFTTAQPTDDAVDLSCSNCHRQDGGGAGGPSVIGQEAEHLMEHAQGDGTHPEGVKYPDLTAQDFADMAAFLVTSGEVHED